MGLTAVKTPQPAVSAHGRLGQAILHRRKSVELQKIPRGYCGCPAGRFSASIRQRVASPLTARFLRNGKSEQGRVPRLSSPSGTKRVSSYLTVDHSGVNLGCYRERVAAL